MSIYNALKIAKYTVGYCTKINRPISNLQLQKILYFIQGEYYKQKSKFLFEDDFLAWQLGPVVESVYDHYSVYGGSKIYDNESYDIDEDTTSIINKTIQKRCTQSAWELVNEAHRPGGAWSQVCNGSKNTVIPKNLIIQEFKNN